MTSLRDLIRLHLAAAALFAFAATAEAAERGPSGPAWRLAQNDPDAPADDGQSEAGLVVRITRLEGQLRQLTGQIEQLQFQNKRLEDQLRKMQQDVDFRFQDLGRAAPGRPAAQKRGDAGKPDQPVVAAADPVTAELDPALSESAPPEAASTSASGTVAPRQVRKSGDAFDPDADPSAPGAPKPLGTTAASEPLPPRAAAVPRPAALAAPAAAGTPHAPMELMPSAALRPADTPGSDPAPRTASIAPEEATPVPGNARSEYDAGTTLFKTGQFDAAANGFQGFLQKYPKDRLAPDATYLLGESYARLGRQREAAEQFLKVSTDFTRSNRAPDALLRLGVALNALGAKEQACATYQEVDRKYPAASADVRAGVERELKRARC